MADLTNPFQSPAVAEEPQVVQRMRVATRVRIPATCLIVAAILHLLFMLFMAAVSLRYRPTIAQDIGAYYTTIFILYALVQCFQRFGAIRMWQFRSVRASRLAALVASIPFLASGIWLGVPFGIWSAIVLFIPSTAEEFDVPK
jgi:hypothetical protein